MAAAECEHPEIDEGICMKCSQVVDLSSIDITRYKKFPGGVLVLKEEAKRMKREKKISLFKMKKLILVFFPHHHSLCFYDYYFILKMILSHLHYCYRFIFNIILIFCFIPYFISLFIKLCVKIKLHTFYYKINKNGGKQKTSDRINKKRIQRLIFIILL